MKWPYSKSSKKGCALIFECLEMQLHVNGKNGSVDSANINIMARNMTWSCKRLILQRNFDHIKANKMQVMQFYLYVYMLNVTLTYGCMF